MVEPILAGRLGNFMFQVANAYAYSLRHKMEYNVPKHEYISRFFPNIECNKELPASHSFWREPTHGYTEIPYFEHLQVTEYFQSELYFKDYRAEVLKLFNVPYEFKKGVCSIHIRRGDYTANADVFPPITNAYINAAIGLIINLTGVTRFLVFGDDAAWNKANVNSSIYAGCTFEYSEGQNELGDIALMSGCEYNIIANSTFSWWGAWLNQNKNKVVVSPSYYPGNWFGKRVPHVTKDVIPKSWYQIKF